VTQPTRFKALFTKWRIALFLITVIYALCLLYNLGFMSVQWDEMPHLYGSLLLTHGQANQYMTTYGYYPPLYDLLATTYFTLFGIAADTGRLVAVTFSFLSIWIVFELANRLYGQKAGLLSSIFLAIMPGFFWVSRITMLETMVVFFFSLIMLLFYSWLKTNRNQTLILTGIAVGVGFLAKYQIVVTGIIMIASIVFLARNKIKEKLSRIPIIVLVAIAVVLPWFLILYHFYGLSKFNEIISVIKGGDENRAIYSVRFPQPIFYFIEIAWPYNDVHPISLFLYLIGLSGLAFFAYRRKPEDKFLLIWFAVIFVFFTIVPNRQWRYVIPLFPVIAISAANLFTSTITLTKEKWKLHYSSPLKKNMLKTAAVALILFTCIAGMFSVSDAYNMVSRDQVHIPIDAATAYVAGNITQTQSIIVLCAFNLFNRDMVKLYLHANVSTQNEVLQYPELPIDAFTPNFDINQLVDICQMNNVKYAFLYEYGGTIDYFNSSLNAMDVYLQLIDSGRFINVTRCGTSPHTITVFYFS